MGILFALLFKNMILSVLIFGFYRVFLEPIVRSLVDKEASWYFPTKFVSKLTPEPDILNIVKEKLEAAEQATPAELESMGDKIFPDIPIVQNIVLSLIFLSLILFLTYFVFQKRRMN